MFQVVERVCRDRADILGEIIAFQTAFEQFRAILAQLLETGQFRSQPLTGITQDKSADRLKLCKLIAKIAGFIYAYASAAKNNTLKAEVDFSHTKFLQMRENQLIFTTQNIYDLAVANLRALKDYGVTQAKLDELRGALDAFIASKSNPRSAQMQKITLTAKENQLIEDIDEILTNQLDLLIENYEEAHPEFVTNYHESRKIKDPATTKTQLSGMVTNKADGSPIKGATVTVVELNLTRKTNSAGEYLFKPVDQGNFAVKVTAEGFLDFETDEIRVKLGEINGLNITLKSI